MSPAHEIEVTPIVQLLIGDVAHDFALPRDATSRRRTKKRDLEQAEQQRDAFDAPIFAP